MTESKQEVKKRRREWWLVGRKYVGLRSVHSSEADADKEMARLNTTPGIRLVPVKVHVREVSDE